MIRVFIAEKTIFWGFYYKELTEAHPREARDPPLDLKNTIFFRVSSVKLRDLHL